MIYDYVITKPPLNEETLEEFGVLEHGWLKDQAAKVHKYIERWRGKNGKWYYKYKNSVKNAINKYKSFRQNLKVKDTRRALHIRPDQVTAYTKRSWLPYGNRYEAAVLNKSSGSGSGRPKSYGNDSGSIGARKVKTKSDERNERADKIRANKKRVLNAYWEDDKSGKGAKRTNSYRKDARREISAGRERVSNQKSEKIRKKKNNSLTGKWTTRAMKDPFKSFKDYNATGQNRGQQFSEQLKNKRKYKRR